MCALKFSYLNQHSTNALNVSRGLAPVRYLSLKGLPFIHETDVKVIVIPKIDLKKLSLATVKNLTREIKGNLSDDIISDRKGS